MVKNLPAMQEMQVHSLGWEDPIEKEMTIHSSTLAWEIPSTGEPGGLQFMGSQRVRHDRVTNVFLSVKVMTGFASLCSLPHEDTARNQQSAA